MILCQKTCLGARWRSLSLPDVVSKVLTSIPSFLWACCSTLPGLFYICFYFSLCFLDCVGRWLSVTHQPQRCLLGVHFNFMLCPWSLNGYLWIRGGIPCSFWWSVGQSSQILWTAYWGWAEFSSNVGTGFTEDAATRMEVSRTQSDIGSFTAALDYTRLFQVFDWIYITSNIRWKSAKFSQAARCFAYNWTNIVNQGWNIWKFQVLFNWYHEREHCCELLL